MTNRPLTLQEFIGPISSQDNTMMQMNPDLELPGEEPTKAMFLQLHDDVTGDGKKRKDREKAENGEGDAGGDAKAKKGKKK